VNLWVVVGVVVVVAGAFLFGLQVGLGACADFKEEQASTYAMRVQGVDSFIDGLGGLQFDNSTLFSE
jgi:hypothetical protein